MSVQEMQSAVSGLSREDLSEFARWFEEFLADAWDRQIEEDVRAGRLDKIIREVESEKKAGRSRPI